MSRNTASYPIPSHRRALFWFRRDLRLADNAGLYYALRSAPAVHTVFVFDRAILDRLGQRADRRVTFIWDSLRSLDAALREHGGGLTVLHADAREAIPQLAASLSADAVFTNEDYEPEAVARDATVASTLQAAGIAFHRYKDSALLHKDEVMTQGGKPYVVYTPYARAWRKACTAFQRAAYPVERFCDRLAAPRPPALPALETLGFERGDLHGAGVAPGTEGGAVALAAFLPRICDYAEQRNFPAAEGVSSLSVHNRFGTLSIRQLAREAHDAACAGADAWLGELAWRDFFFQIIHHYPHAATGAFRREYDAIAWPNDESAFAAWCSGRTGYPLVDAGMRQLVQTGAMHNRVRMVTASFLVKDLLVDWRWGERFFAEHLLDYDLAANNGNWQWAASTGCDAQPYFRIFNPVTQSEKFDPGGRFIRQWLPELSGVPDAFIHAPWTMRPIDQQGAGCIVGRDYPAPVVDHARQREHALGLYHAVRSDRA